MTRAVLLKWIPTVHACTLETCGQPIKGKKGKRPSVCCNVYENGLWNRVEHFHPECYDGRWGPVTVRPANTVHRSGWASA
jgi:hypothetical protein